MYGLSDFFGVEGFDPLTYEPTKDFEPVPPGEYPVLIELAEVQQNKKANGYFLKLQMAILDGEYKGRKVWDYINIQNPSEQCVAIAMGTLAAIGRALGIPNLNDEALLLNQVIIAHVKVSGEQNSVRTYSSPSAPPETPATAPAPAPPAAPQTFTSTPVPVPQPNYTHPAALASPATVALTAPAPVHDPTVAVDPATYPVASAVPPAVPAPASVVPPAAPVATQVPPWER